MVHDADVFMLLSDPQQRVTYTQQTSAYNYMTVGMLQQQCGMV